MPKRQSPAESGSDNSRIETILKRRDFLRQSILASAALCSASRLVATF